jgi:hypothetical protein
MTGCAAHFNRGVFDFSLISVAGHTGVCRFVAVRICYVNVGENFETFCATSPVNLRHRSLRSALPTPNPDALHQLVFDAWHNTELETLFTGEESSTAFFGLKAGMGSLSYH